MRIVRSQEELVALVSEFRKAPYVAVDTEFMRERTYWPQLCLIQIARPPAGPDDGRDAAIIDPIAVKLDLAPFFALMREPSVTKVFHAARQDVEIFFRLTGAAPTPLFDTQVAAMACGYGDQIGYEPLMRDLLNAQIDKGSRFTDWSRRPLSQSQLAYALSDVTHLRDAFPILRKRLKETGRESWVAEETSALQNPALYRTEPEEAWRRLKLRGVKKQDLGPIMKLAEWREREAQSRDVPRARILKDEAIFELSRLKPTSTDDLARARSMPKGSERSRQGASILEAIAAGKALASGALPKIERGERRPPPADVLDLLKVALKRQCEAFDVAPRLIASSADLEALALDPEADIPAMRGWRREVFGETALALLRGEKALRLVDGKIELLTV